MLKDYEQDLLCCNTCRCGFCREDCPAYKAHKVEGVSPVGRMQILQALYEGSIEPQADLYDRLSQCAGCFYCTERCPVQKNKLTERFNVRIDPCKTTDAGLATLVKHGAIPDVVTSIKDNINNTHNIFGYLPEERDRWQDHLTDTIKPTLKKNKSKVVYFVGCLSALSELQEIPLAFANILHELGVDFTVLGQEEWCCGYRLEQLGLIDEAEKVKAHNIEKVKQLGAESILFSCPSCYMMWKSRYPAGRFELKFSTHFLKEQLAKGKIKLEDFEGEVAFHDPCDLGRNAGDYDTPRDILKMIPGLDLVELDKHHEESLCCGGGRLLDFTHPKIASNISSEFAESIKRSNALLVVEACPQCKRMIQNKTEKPVRDIVEVVYELGQFE